MRVSLIVLIVVLVLTGVVLANVFAWKGSTVAGVSVTTTTVLLGIAALVGGYYIFQLLVVMMPGLFSK